MIIDERKKMFVDVGSIEPGFGFVCEGDYFIVLDRKTIDCTLAVTPVMNLDSGTYMELDNDTPVEKCRYEIHVYD